MNKLIIKGSSITPEEVESAIIAERYQKMGLKMTVCHLTLVNGFEVVGVSGCVNPDNYNQEIGEEIARKEAVNEVWSHMGSILQDRLAK